MSGVAEGNDVTGCYSNGQEAEISCNFERLTDLHREVDSSHRPEGRCPSKEFSDCRPLDNLHQQEEPTLLRVAPFVYGRELPGGLRSKFGSRGGVKAEHAPAVGPTDFVKDLYQCRPAALYRHGSIDRRDGIRRERAAQPESTSKNRPCRQDRGEERLRDRPRGELFCLGGHG